MGDILPTLVRETIRKYVSKYAAILGCLIFATSPFHIFYSQEARSTALIASLAVVIMSLSITTAESPYKLRYWFANVLASLSGLYVSYSFTLVIAAQLLFLFFILKLRRQTLAYSAVLALLSLPFVYFFVQSLPTLSAQKVNVNSNMLEFIQALVGGEPVRYGFFWGHPVISAILGMAVVSALLDRQNYSRLFVYCILQVFLPFVLFWGILGPIMHIRLPLSEAKQFIMVLPAFMVLVCYGFQTWLRSYNFVITSKILVAIAFGVVVIASVFSLTRYWDAGKSPEGNAILTLRQQFQPDDSVVSLHYSLNAALSFYMTELTPFTKPALNGNDYLFSHSTTILRDIEPPLRTASVADIFKHARVWLLLDLRRSSEVANMFLQRCVIISQQHFEPFQVVLLNRCQ